MSVNADGTYDVMNLDGTDRIFKGRPASRIQAHGTVMTATINALMQKHAADHGIVVPAGAICLSAELAFRFFSMAHTTPPYNRNFPETWIEGTERLLRRLMGGQLRLDLLAAASGGASFDTNSKADAVRCAEEVRSNFSTCVLATVEAVAWRDAWLSGLLLFLVHAVPVSRQIYQYQRAPRC